MMSPIWFVAQNGEYVTLQGWLSAVSYIRFATSVMNC